MEVETTELQYGGAAERKLLHWVNSLPLTSCLLVEELSDLRFGDALEEIVSWLQTGSRSTEVTTRTAPGRLKIDAVVEFVASQSSAFDQDVVHTIHSAQCASRVAEGDAVAISAVLTVLKRLADDKQAATRSQEQVSRDQQRREIRKSLHSASPLPSSPLFFKRAAEKAPSQPAPPSQLQTANTRHAMKRGSQFRVTTTTSPATATQRIATLALEQDENSQQANRQPQRHKPRLVKASPDIEAKVREAMLWISSLVASQTKLDINEMSAGDALVQLKNGVLLCAVAASIAYRRGSVAMRYKLQQVRPTGTPHEITFPRGASISPRTVAEKKHNLKVAWELLNECRVLPLSPVISDEELVGLFYGDEGKSGDRVWELLCGIRDKLAHTPLMGVSKSTSSTELKTEHSVKHRKRPYITAEQIEIVRRWMKTIGVDPNAVASGIFQDTFRNGVALSKVLLHLRPTAGKELGIKSSPKTLVEVRQNITSIVQKTRSLRAEEGLHVPAVYLSIDAIEGIMMGDKQIGYGILWHLMQFAKQEASRKSIVRLEAQDIPLPPPVILAPTCIVPERTHARDTPTEKHKKLSVFELDIPASELLDDHVGGGDSAVPIASSAFWWDASSALDDILPAPFASRATSSQIHHEFEDIHPRKRPAAPPATVKSLDQPCAVAIMPRSPRLIARPAQPSELVAQPPIIIDEAEDHQPVDAVPMAPAQTSTSNRMNDEAEAEEEEHYCSLKSPDKSVSNRDVNVLLHWLAGLGVELRQPGDLQNPGCKLVEFQSGVVLCSIIEKLEHMRVMEGIDRKPQITKASALHNIDKALAILERKKAIPIRLLRQKLKIYQGDRATILELLLSIRKAYGHHYPHT